VSLDLDHLNALLGSAIDVILSLLHFQILAYLFTGVAVRNMGGVDGYLFN